MIKTAYNNKKFEMEFRKKYDINGSNIKHEERNCKQCDKIYDCINTVLNQKIHTFKITEKSNGILFSLTVSIPDKFFEIARETNSKMNFTISGYKFIVRKDSIEIHAECGKRGSINKLMKKQISKHGSYTLNLAGEKFTISFDSSIFITDSAFKNEMELKNNKDIINNINTLEYYSERNLYMGIVMCFILLLIIMLVFFVL